MVLARDSARTEPWESGSHRDESSIGELGRKRLMGICDCLGLNAERRQQAHAIFEHLSRSWSHRTTTTSPLWPCDIADDGTPFEFSLAFTGTTPQLRVLVESQATEITSTSTWDAAVELNGVLAREGLASLSRFAQIEDIFRPPAQPSMRFSLWHASVLQASGDVLIKAYLNPAVRGDRCAAKLVQCALERLGHADSWKFLERRMLDESNRVMYFALDLAAGPSARVKVYIGRHDSVDGIERLIAGSANVESRQASEWVGTLAGRSRDFDARPVLACFAFTEAGAPPVVTLHVPVRCYLASDAESVRAVSRYLTHRDAATLEDVTRNLADVPLAASRGVLSYASLRARGPRSPDVTAYLAPQLYSRALR